MPLQRSIVVLGLMSKMPVAGVVWQTLHYLLGFEQLGYRAHYVEAHARTPSMLMSSPGDDGSAKAAAFISAIMRRSGFADRWAFHALHGDGRSYGMSERQLERLLASADLLINLHGGTLPTEELAATGRLVYVETDPVQPQVEIAHGLQSTVDFLDAHMAHFTFAENYGAPDCGLPWTDRFQFHTTRQPVACELWETDSSPARTLFTTIGNWRQEWRDVWIDGETYGWSKDHEFEKVLDLPSRVGARFELALASYEEADQERLERNGWQVAHALSFSTDQEAYRAYIRDSYGEFTVAKDQNVRLRTGWFSDRSATYLASGRPVITQDTGFGAALPTGAGLFSFKNADEVVDAIGQIDAEPGRHQRAAREIAREHFAAPVVLGEMVGLLGERPPGAPPRTPRSPYPPQLRLAPVSRRPLVLDPETVKVVESAPIARARLSSPRTAPGSRQPGVDASIVIVTCNGLVFTRMCMETVLAGTDPPRTELIVVDNASSDGTREYIQALAACDDRVHLVANECNRGFPRACNQGLALARGRLLVLLNNDTMVAPGWLARLTAPLADERVGLVGPVTNRIGNEAEIATGYETWGGFLGEARRRAIRHSGTRLEISTVTMFCLAMRRDVHERLGPLDDGYGLGMLEDDDYSMRAREAGYRQLCVHDVLVHHFGEATFGTLYASGERAQILQRNRARYKARWGQDWQQYGRGSDDGYEALVDDVRVLLGTLPPASKVLVVSKGDDRLLSVAQRTAWHYPCSDEGEWAGHHPADSAEAIDRLERLQRAGATHIAFPRFSMWWLEYYEELAARLRTNSIVIDDESCVVFSLTESEPAEGVVA